MASPAAASEAVRVDSDDENDDACVDYELGGPRNEGVSVSTIAGFPTNPIVVAAVPPSDAMSSDASVVDDDDLAAALIPLQHSSLGDTELLPAPEPLVPATAVALKRSKGERFGRVLINTVTCWSTCMMV